MNEKGNAGKKKKLILCQVIVIKLHDWEVGNATILSSFTTNLMFGSEF